ncbi:MAG: SCO family protein [Silvibacterium sp.]
MFARTRGVFHTVAAAVLLSAISLSCQAQNQSQLPAGVKHYPAFGIVLKVDPAHHTFTASTQAIPGFMDAMVMPFNVRDAQEFHSLRTGEIIDFTLAVGKDASWAENIRQHVFQNADEESQESARLRLLQSLNAPKSTVKELRPGDEVPDFALTDQTGAPIRLSQFRGKVVALTFMYTKCPLPDYCFRLNNNFGNLQRRFAPQLGKNLVFLSVSFDPVHDQPPVLAEYARTWNANPKGWHFLTGPLPVVEKVCHEFNLNFWEEMGMITHTLHTVIIDRHGRVVANLEGNQFSAKQLGDLIQMTLNQGILNQSEMQPANSPLAARK